MEMSYVFVENVEDSYLMEMWIFWKCFYSYLMKISNICWESRDSRWRFLLELLKISYISLKISVEVVEISVGVVEDFLHFVEDFCWSCWDFCWSCWDFCWSCWRFALRSPILHFCWRCSGFLLKEPPFLLKILTDPDGDLFWRFPYLPRIPYISVEVIENFYCKCWRFPILTPKLLMISAKVVEHSVNFPYLSRSCWWFLLELLRISIDFLLEISHIM